MGQAGGKQGIIVELTSVLYPSCGSPLQFAHDPLLAFAQRVIAAVGEPAAMNPLPGFQCLAQAGGQLFVAHAANLHDFRPISLFCEQGHGPFPVSECAGLSGWLRSMLRFVSSLS